MRVPLRGSVGVPLRGSVGVPLRGEFQGRNRRLSSNAGS